MLQIVSLQTWTASSDEEQSSDCNSSRERTAISDYLETSGTENMIRKVTTNCLS